MRGDDADEVALLNHLHARDVRDRALVDAEHGRSLAESRLPARANDPAVEHPGDADVLDVGRLPGDDVRDVDPRNPRPDQLVAARGRERRLRGGDRAVEELPGREVGVLDRLAAAGDDAVRDRQARRRHTELRRGHVQEQRPRSGRSPAHARRAHRGRGRGAPDRERRQRHVRVDLHLRHLVHREPELLRRDHANGGRRALAELRPTREQRHGVVGVHLQPRVDLGRVGRAGKRARVRRGDRGRVVRGPCRLGGKPADAEADHERAAPAQERLARELALGQNTCIGGHVHHLLRICRRGHHAPAFAITAAAFWIAVRIRGYVPQRHRCPFIAVRI